MHLLLCMCNVVQIGLKSHTLHTIFLPCAVTSTHVVHFTYFICHHFKFTVFLVFYFINCPHVEMVPVSRQKKIRISIFVFYSSYNSYLHSYERFRVGLAIILKYIWSPLNKEKFYLRVTWYLLLQDLSTSVNLLILHKQQLVQAFIIIISFMDVRLKKMDEEK